MWFQEMVTGMQAGSFTVILMTVAHFKWRHEHESAQITIAAELLGHWTGS